MLPQVFEEMASRDSSSWYYTGKRAALVASLKKARIIPSKVVDIGCGTGANIEIFDGISGPDVSYIGIEPRPMIWKAAGRRNARLIMKDFNDVASAELGSSADLVMMIDVLEHIDENSGLRAARRLLADNGSLLITVPAYDCLWGKSDIDSRHLRRYSPHRLNQALERNGFKIIYLNHYFAFAFLPLLILSFFQRRRRSGDGRGYFGPSGFDWLLVPVVKAEAFLSRWLKLPCGTGLVCVARKV
ncbi:class I SAM-dependent methyltransferase [Patescibacteria group bacterium]|nr:class I SAM-dependent methyltransferase [Patescibacteria group bacterium]MBU1034936.1 class I SAM-dependent methyltransferase [Patescibacteria group bacterium]MBU1630108.1 class I SAM-dependent methyltransferase [Patescibacteria group bacterium]MBU1907615.1 class I SAM-dependent methyltransferase [Patescibacteria group bacterium]